MNIQNKTTYVITPYSSVGNFTFGATQKEIKRMSGDPFKVEIDNIMKNIVEQRETCCLVFEKNKLSYVEINKHAEVWVANTHIYSEGAIEALMDIDKDCVAGSRYINFRGLGVCLGGFGKKRIPEGKVVIAYGKSKIEFFDFYASQ